jgi:hypothetical protein
MRTARREARILPAASLHQDSRSGDRSMSKGMNQKKEQKKKPANTVDEKRAAKKAKKAERARGQ